MTTPVDQCLAKILHLANQHLPNTAENEQIWFNQVSDLLDHLRAGIRPSTKLLSLGEGRVNVGFPGMMLGDLPKVEMQERKILIARGPTTQQYIHIMWKDPEDKGKGIELVNYANGLKASERFDL